MKVNPKRKYSEVQVLITKHTVASARDEGFFNRSIQSTSTKSEKLLPPRAEYHNGTISVPEALHLYACEAILSGQGKQVGGQTQLVNAISDFFFFFFLLTITYF